MDIVIPYWNGTPERKRNLEYIINRYSALGHTIFIGSQTQGSKAEAIDSGIRRAHSDVVAICDADCYVPNLWHFGQCLVSEWGQPFTKVARLTESGTESFIEDRKTQPESITSNAYPGGGCIVINRNVWNQCPMDPEYIGWGQEDISWALALDAMYGSPNTANETLYHLWHKPAPRMSKVFGSPESRARYIKYRLAARGYRAGNNKPLERLLAPGREMANG